MQTQVIRSEILSGKEIIAGTGNGRFSGCSDRELFKPPCMTSITQLIKRSILLQIELKTQQIRKDLCTCIVEVFTLGTVESVIL